MNQSNGTDHELGKMGWYIRHIGVAVCIGSIISGLCSKAGSTVYFILFWICLTILAGVSIFYFIARRLSERWRSKGVRSYFSPYIIAATIWVLLILFLAVLYRLS